MDHQNEREKWNRRWKRQIAQWERECDAHLDQAEALLALIKLAKAQIKDPPE